MKAPLYLIGILNGDLKGRERLGRVLDQTQPRAVMVEGSESILGLLKDLNANFQEQLQKTLSKKGYTPSMTQCFRGLIATDSPYAMEVCRQYSKDAGVPIVYLEKPEEAEKTIAIAQKTFDRFLQNLPSGKTFKKMIAEQMEEEYQEHTDNTYSNIEGIIRNKLVQDAVQQVLKPFRAHLGGKQSLAFEEIIRPVVASYNEPIAAVLGVYHLSSDPRGETLYERVKDLNPMRMTLKVFG